MKKCCSETPHPIERLLFRICVAPFLSVISWLVTRLLFRICVQNLCSSFSVSYQLISDKWTHKWNSFLWAIQLLPLWQKVSRKAHCKSIIMSEKRTRISLAQKLDIIEASKKSGFSIGRCHEEVWFEEINSVQIIGWKGKVHTTRTKHSFIQPC